MRVGELCTFTLILYFRSCVSTRYGHPASTLYASTQHSIGDGPRKFTFERPTGRNEHVEHLSTNQVNERRKRETLSPGSNYSANNMSSVFSLNDNHEQLSVHWAGRNSDVIFCLARDRRETANSTSSVFISYDYGTTFEEVQNSKMRISKHTPSIISTFDISLVLNSHIVFTDVVHDYIFTSRDFGKTIVKIPLSFSPDEVAMHPTNVEIILAMDKRDPQKTLWYSDDFGVTWKEIQQQVKAFHWGIDKIDPENTLFVERMEPNNKSTILSSSDFFQSNDHPQILMTNVKDFEVQDKYLFITRKQRPSGFNRNNGTLQLWISYNRQPFKMAQFPGLMERKEIYVVDASDDQVLICVMHNEMTTNLYVSDAQGMKFSLSLENILYISSSVSEGSFLSKESFADIHKVNGLRGVYIATQLKPGSTQSTALENLVSVITFDKGGEWKYLNPPKVDRGGNPITCEMSKGCSLHLTQKFSQIYQRYRTVPILSRKSAVGMIIASGVIGKSLKGHASVFISSDAGVTWREVMYGGYTYMFGDFGGIIVAVQFFSQQETNQIKYSTDDGETWETLNFTKPGEEPIRVYELLTEPGEKQPIFTLFGSSKHSHQWQLIKLNLTHVFKHTCLPDDYKLWSPHMPGRPCLLGRKEIYERRIAHTSCYSGKNYQRPVQIENCPCEREDFECDFGFKDDFVSGNCVRDTDSEGDPDAIPLSCNSGDSYNRTKGYRKIPGDTCVDGDDFLYLPEIKPCPIEDEAEFLLLAELHRISRVNLNSKGAKLETLALPDVDNVIALDYHSKDHCIFWEDTSAAKILRHCLVPGGKHSVVAESNMLSIEGLALDWLSNNLYFSDRERSTIEVVRSNMESGQIRRTVLNNTYIEKPRGIAVHPVAGYLFMTDWSVKKPSVSRSYLDGTHFTVLIDSSKVTWPNGVTVDLASSRIFWTDARFYYIASADFNGQDIKYVVRGENLAPHPFAVAVYKDWLYFDDWSKEMILMANKHDGSGLIPLTNTSGRGMDLKVFAHGLQSSLVSNACSDDRRGNCSHFCIPYPGGSHVCLCPAWALIEKLSNGSEICRCSDMTLMPTDGVCEAASKCKPDEFHCSNGTCLPASKKCNGFNDCGDYSDEGSICESACAHGLFNCKNGHCVHSKFQCNFEDDCGDNSDEEDCGYQKCTDDEFECGNKRCIKKNYVCDFDDDCRDGSDEFNCTYPTDSCRREEFNFKCKSGKQCLPLSWRCDGAEDCADGSDEELCDKATCEPGKFHCGDGRCIFDLWVCDGFDDCTDSSDEQNCNTSATTATPTTNLPPTSTSPGSTGPCSAWMFKCNTGPCIPFWWHCDGVNDCGDMSDETMCGSESSSVSPPSSHSSTAKPGNCGENRFECNSGICIWSSFVCDGMIDCIEGEDEHDCEDEKSCDSNSFRCVHSTGCIPHKLICNGQKDCGDGSDEWGCQTEHSSIAPLTCSLNEFLCKSGDCIDFIKMCDRNEDCPDGSDETSCPDGQIYFRIRNLRFLRDSVSPHSFTIRWDPPFAATPKMKLQYKPSFREATVTDFLNASWVDSTSYTFDNLTSGTDYVSTVYTRVSNHTEVAPPTEFITVRTHATTPNPPFNVSVKIFHSTHVQVLWDLPANLSSKITACRVYFSPPYPPHFETTKVAKQPLTLNFNFEPGVNYTFWMTSFIDDLESMKSQPVVIDFAQDAVLSPILNLHPTKVDNRSISIAWNHTQNKGDGYTVQYWPKYISDRFKAEKNTSGDNLTVKNLAPGANYVFKLFSHKGVYRGPDTKLLVTTTGVPLPVVTDFSEKTTTDSFTLSWSIPKDDNRAQWTYGIYMLSSKINDFELIGTTTYTNYTVKNLSTCTVYTVEVRVVEPFGIGPSKDVHYVGTHYDLKSAPRNLTVNVLNSDYMKINWEASCDSIDEKIGYVVSIVDEVLNVDNSVQLVPRTDIEMSFKYAMHYGGNYTIKVQTNATGSQIASTIFLAPELPSVTQVKAFREQNGSIYVDWKEVQWPEALKNHKFSYCISLSLSNNMNEGHKYYVSKPPFVLHSHPFSGKTVIVAVNVKEEHGYQSRLSDLYALASDSGYAAVVLTASSLVSIGVGVGVVIILLAVTAVVFAVRHRRLQRSFMSFANSHYDTRSGAATFTTEGLEEEEESPMIRGFSDDEPLVIA